MEDASQRSTEVLGFRVLLLGPFALERGGVPIDVGKWQRRVEILFKLLATAPDLRRSRDELIDVLWPDAVPDAGAAPSYERPTSTSYGGQTARGR